MPKYKSTELREKRASLIDENRTVDLAEASAEDLSAFDQRSEQIETLEADISRMEKQEGYAPLQQQRAALDAEAESVEDTEAREVKPTETPEYRAAFEGFLRGHAANDPEVRTALKVATSANGGYTVPHEFYNGLIEAEREFSVMRQVANVVTTGNAGTFEIPTVATHATAEWIEEEGAFPESEPTFGQVTLNAWKVGAYSKISDELATDSAFDIVSYVAKDLGQAIGLKEGSAFVVGDNNAKPNGIVTAATVGKTATTATAITAGDLLALFGSVINPYRSRGSFLMNDSTITAIRGITDTTGQFIWQPGLQAGAPDVLLGRPVYTDPFMPTVASGNKSVIFGDLSQYWIRDVETITVKYLQELFALNGQIGVRVHRRTDGELVGTSAVKALKN